MTVTGGAYYPGVIDVRATPFGRPAAALLRDVLREAKQGDPLAPVTVLVPTNYVGVSVRRKLADGRLGRITDAGVGVAGVDLLTVYRLAELLGASQLAAEGRRPVSNPVVAAAVRAALDEEPGVFAGVADHPATERALVRVHRELRDLDEDGLSALESASRRARDVVRVHRLVDRRLADGWHDEFDLMAAASRVVSSAPGHIRELGRVVLYLPQDLSRAAARFLLGVAELAPMTCIVGVTGNARTDAAAGALVARLGVALPPVAVTMPAANHIVTVSDADDEVRTVIRQVVGDLDDGVPLERIGILYGSPEPYARLLDEQLAAAGLARNGDAVRSLAESVVGRATLSLLALPDHGHRRAELFELLSTAPIRVRAEEALLVPVAAWDRLARAAGVIGGLPEWRQRLGNHRNDLTSEIERLERHEPDHPRIGAASRDIALSEELLAFVEELVSLLEPQPRPSTWTQHVAWVRRLLQRFVGPADDDWPEVEQLAAEQLDRVLERLAGLDLVEPETGIGVFRRTLELEMDTGLGRTGQIGEGVFVGRVAQALGIDFERLYVLGMAEGTFPARRRDDSLLPDDERSRTDGALSLRAADVDEQHRFYLAALASTEGRCTLLFPRGDLRRSAERVPSRWLLDTAASLGGGRFDASRLEAAAHDPDSGWVQEQPSFVAGLRRSSFPATRQEYDLVSLMQHTERGLPVSAHPLVDESAAFRLGVELTEGRDSATFTRFDGNLSGVVSAEGVRVDVLSPTRLENWAACPHRYLMQAVLGLGETDTPEALLRVDALERGTLMHDALDRFFTESAEAGLLPEPGKPFSPEAADRLAEIAREAADRLEARGLVGKHIFWERDRRDILADLGELLRRDAQREHRGKFMASELGFGVAGASQPAVTHTLADGRQIRFRGSIDRLERTAQGTLVVIDYKTGGDKSFSKLSQHDPVLNGTKLQLPVYALAARAHSGEDAPVHAAYWFITEDKGRWRWLGLDIDDAVMQRFDEVLSVIVGGIERGLFPPHPPEHDSPFFVECPSCNPDGLGTSELRAQWTRKRHDPLLADYLELVEPESANEEATP